LTGRGGCFIRPIFKPELRSGDAAKKSASVPLVRSCAATATRERDLSHATVLRDLLR
jgi:hypothetical protein